MSSEINVPLRIVAFGNRRYKKIAHNWALYLHHHKIKNYTIYSLDHDIYDYLCENDVNTELISLNMFESKSWAWIERVKFIYNLLNDNVGVLHSDLDAVWLKNPLSLIDGQHDIIASTGTFPRSVYIQQGYTICMGWIYYKSSSIVKELFINILNQNTRDEFDDQVKFNTELFNTSKYQSLRLKILNQSIISRGENHDENTFVAHPYSDKNIDREKFLKDKKLWILE